MVDFGVFMFYDKLVGFIFGREMEGLFDEINSCMVDFLINGWYLCVMIDEMVYYYKILECVGVVIDFGDLFVRIFFFVEWEISEEVY